MTTTTGDPYVPLPDSMGARLCAFFLRDSDTQLGVKDIALKFDVPVGSVHTGLRRCVEAQLLTRDDGEYRAGPRLVTLTPEPGPHNVFGGTSKQRRASPRMAPMLDAATVKVVAGLAKPQAARGHLGRAAANMAVVDRLQVGSAAVLTHQQAESLYSWIQRRLATDPRRFSKARIDDTSSGIWRDA